MTIIRLFVLAVLALALAGCVALGGPPLQAGVDGVEQVQARLGDPYLRWRDDDGGEQWAYPRGPMGTQTWMVFLAADGRLQRIEQVLTSRHFARIRPGVDDVQSILRLIGPPNPGGTVEFAARNELAWEWLICDDWSQLARFGVLFDARSGIVRSSYQLPELRGRNSSAPWCSH